MQQEGKKFHEQSEFILAFQKVKNIRRSRIPFGAIPERDCKRLLKKREKQNKVSFPLCENRKVRNNASCNAVLKQHIPKLELGKFSPKILAFVGVIK